MIFLLHWLFFPLKSTKKKSQYHLRQELFTESGSDLPRSCLIFLFWQNTSLLWLKCIISYLALVWCLSLHRKDKESRCESFLCVGVASALQGTIPLLSLPWVSRWLSFGVVPMEPAWSWLTRGLWEYPPALLSLCLQLPREGADGEHI